MSRITTQLYDTPGGNLILDMTGRVQGARFATNERGFHDWSGFVPMSSAEAFRWYDFASGHLVISFGAIVLYQGRVEDPKVNGDPSQGPVGLDLVCFGYSQTYSDVPYTALWATKRLDLWEPVVVDTLSSRESERYNMTTDLALRISPSKGESFDTTHIGSMTYAIPHNSARQIVTVSFSYEMRLPSSNWLCSLSRYSNGYTFLSTVWTQNGSGAVQSGTQSLTVLACDRLMFNVVHNVARTTLGTTIAAGVQSPTPGSMTAIAVGSVLHIGNNGGAVGSQPEDVVVTAVTGTTFTATFTTPHNLNDTVSFVYTDETEANYLKITNLQIKTTTTSTVDTSEIARALRDYVDAANPTQVDLTVDVIQSAGMNHKEALWEDMYPADILDELCLKGDSSGRRLVWAVWELQRLRVHYEGYGGQTWYVDEAPTLLRSIDGIRNEAYALYQDVSGRTKRTAVATDAGSLATFGLRRRAVVDAQTTDATDAATIRDTSIRDTRYNGSLGEFSIKALRTVDGAVVPGWQCRAGDTIIVRGYPAGSAGSIDYIRSFPVLGTDFAYGERGDRRQLGSLRIISTRLPVSLPGLLARKG